MDQIKIFENKTFGQLRTTIINGEPWFVANDVCSTLEIGNSRQALVRLDDDEKGVISTDTPGGKQEMSTVNESGLYSLILGSRKPEAKAFKRWITHEVIPSIRKTGGYIAQQEELSEAELLARSHEIALKILANREKRLKEAEAQIQNLSDVVVAQEEQIKEMSPKSEYYNIILSCKDPIPTRIIAKDYGWSAQQLNKYLYSRRVQYKINGIWVLYQDHADKGYTQTKTSYHYDEFGHAHADIFTYWTQTGRKFIYDLLKEDGIYPLVEQID